MLSLNNFTENKTKKSIIINDNMKNLGDSLCNHMIEVDKKPNDDDYLYLLICTIINKNEVIDNQSYLNFNWKLSKDELNEINFQNNLDSLIDYDDGFNTVIDIIFPLIECIRLHYSSNTVIFEGTFDTETNIYIKLPKIINGMGSYTYAN